jgi:hypothetical protein
VRIAGLAAIDCMIGTSAIVFVKARSVWGAGLGKLDFRPDPIGLKSQTAASGISTLRYPVWIQLFFLVGGLCVIFGIVGLAPRHQALWTQYKAALPERVLSGSNFT